MEYKHTKRRSTDHVQDIMWSAMYCGDTLEGDGLELSADGYGALVSPTSASGGAAAAARGGNERRSKSTPRGRENNVGDAQHGRSQSPSNNAGGRNSVAMRRPRSAGKQRTAAAGMLNRNDTPASTAEAGASGGGFLGGILRRRKKKPQDRGNPGNHPPPPTKKDNVCDYCQRVVKGKTRNQMFRRLEYAYCTTECTKMHQQALNAEGGTVTGQVGARVDPNDQTFAIGKKTSGFNIESNFRDNGFGSPPITPSMALLKYHPQQETNNQQQGRNNTNRNGNQFFPPNVTSTLMASSSSDGKHNSNGEDDSTETDYCRSFSTGTSFGAPAPYGHTATSNRSGKYSRGISNESQDYNDELARQLLLAAREDELTSKERAYQRQQLLTARYSAADSSPDVFGTPGTYSTLSESNVGESSPGRYAKRLSNMGVTGTSPATAIIATNKNDGQRSSSDTRKNRRHYSTMKQNEYSTQTESTQSLSSSSQGGFSSNHDIGNLNAGVLHRGTTSPQSFPQLNSRKTHGGYSVSPWRHLTVDSGCVSDARDFIDEAATENSWEINSKQSNSELSRAFEELSGWTSSVKIKDDIKTPRVSNHSSNFGRISDDAHDRLESANTNDADPGNGRDLQLGRDTEDENTNIIYSTYKKKYDRHVSSLSDTSLHAIYEDRTDCLSSQLFAHKKGLRSTNATPLSNQKSPSMKASSKVDHAVEDVVSIVSYYDDPSVDMLSSLATNDTISTIGPIPKQQRGRPSQPFTTKSPDANSELKSTIKIKIKAKDSTIMGQQHEQPKSDPPGISIDEMIKHGIHRRQQVGHGHNYRRNPSRDPSHGVDPEGMQQLMKMHNEFEEERRKTEENMQGNVHSPQIRDQQRLPLRGISTSYSNHRSPQIPQPHNPCFTRMDPSVHGKDPDDEQHLMNIQHKEEPISKEEYGKGDSRSSQGHDEQHQHMLDSEYSQSRFSSTQREQRQEQRPNSEYNSQQGQRQSHFTKSHPVHGKDSDDEQQLMHIEHGEDKILREEYENGNMHSSQGHGKQHQHLPDSEYSQIRFRSTHKEHRQANLENNTKQRQGQSHFTKRPEERTPPQLRPLRQEIGRTSMIMAQHHNHIDENEDGRYGQEESDRFDVADIEFSTPSLEKDDNDSKLTGEVEDEPSTSHQGDDDTAGNTLDTVDLVAEVKRVWRHVQRYENKKHIKKQMKKQYLGKNHGGKNVSDGDNVLGRLDEGGEMEELEENNTTVINSRFLQSIQMHTPPKHNGDGGSKFSDITPSSTDHIRGTASKRRPTIPTDGRLGTHIRGTSSHSRAHTPAPGSPGMDSAHAMASHASTRASTEKDAVFLNEGVEEFYEDPGKQTMKQFQNRNGATAIAHHSHLGTSSAQYRQSVRYEQAAYSTSHSIEEGQGLTQEEDNRLLSQPYDMTKVKSTGTSVTHTTQRVSNMSTTPHALRSEMARKYIKQRQGLTFSAADAPSQDHQQHNPHNFNGIHQQVQQKQQVTTRGITTTVQNSKERKAYKNNHGTSVAFSDMYQC